MARTRKGITTLCSFLLQASAVPQSASLHTGTTYSTSDSNMGASLAGNSGDRWRLVALWRISVRRMHTVRVLVSTVESLGCPWAFIVIRSTRGTTSSTSIVLLVRTLTSRSGRRHNPPFLAMNDASFSHKWLRNQSLPSTHSTLRMANSRLRVLCTVWHHRSNLSRQHTRKSLTRGPSPPMTSTRPLFWCIRYSALRSAGRIFDDQCLCWLQWGDAVSTTHCSHSTAPSSDIVW